MSMADTARRGSAARTQTSIAIDKLRTDIITGKLRPNEKLRVQALAQRYGLAASALREALSRLVTDALVMAEDQRGFRVSPVSRGGLLDLTEARVGIECLALTRSIEYGDVAWESDVVGAYHRLSRCTETTRPDSPEAALWGTAHAEFHRTLIAACRSEWLMYFCALMYQQSDRYRLLATFSRAAGNRNPLAEHEAMMKAAIGRDAPRARELLSEHFRATTRRLLEAGAVQGGLASEQAWT
jgi:DNA-binding GntR family transcriptional regulator